MPHVRTEHKPYIIWIRELAQMPTGLGKMAIIKKKQKTIVLLMSVAK